MSALDENPRERSKDLEPTLPVNTKLNAESTDSFEDAFHRNSTIVHIIQHHLYTLWLFTFSDLKTIVFPKTAFGILGSLSGPVLTTNDAPDTLNILSRIPLVLLWIWLNLLPFDIDNQRKPEAVQEDAVNKSWRPMPSRRLTFEQATYTMFAFYFIAFAVSLYLGAAAPCVALMVFGYLYNGLGGADRSCIIRNFINALGYLSFASGAAIVATGHCQFSLKPVAYSWLLVVAGVVFTTVHLQDMYDQEGDSARGRWTVPLVIGDIAARWSIAIPVLIWSFICPYFWGLGPEGIILPAAIGIIVAVRTVSRRTVVDDKLTFKIWNLWMAALYLLPLFKLFSISGSDSFVFST